MASVDTFAVQPSRPLEAFQNGIRELNCLLQKSKAVFPRLPPPPPQHWYA